jgi:hypothetical protein
MGPVITWPQVPEGFESWSGEQKAKWIVERWAIAAEAYSLSEAKRATLIDWINQ